MRNNTINTMTYKNYLARIEYSAEDACLIGRLLEIHDLITFHGDTVEEIRKAFEESVDFYLETCARDGISPQKAYSGRMMLRIEPSLHAKLAIQAQASGQSINHWIASNLEKIVESRP